MKTYEELDKELIDLYNDVPSNAQKMEIVKIKAEYKDKATALVRKYMQKEIDVLNNTQLKLSI